MVSIKNDETYLKLLEMALETYEVKEKIENCRLRAFLPHSGSKEDTYGGKEKLTLKELNIKSYKTMIIEIKKDEEKFEEFDKDKTFIRICKFKEGLTSLTNDVNNNAQRLDLSKKSTIKELMEKVSIQFDIPFEFLKVLKKTNINGKIEARIISEPENFNKNLLECCLIQNMVLFVEGKGENASEIKWSKEFDEENYKFNIKFNSPFIDNQIEDPGMVDYNNVIIVDGRDKIQELKTRICEFFNVKCDEIMIFRGGRNGIELKELEGIIYKNNLTNGSAIYVQFGTPSKFGFFKILFSIARKTKLNEDNFYHTFEDLFDLSIDSNLKPSEIKKIVCEEAFQRKS